MKNVLLASVFAFVAFGSSAFAGSEDNPGAINTGGVDGAYNTKFCPPLKAALEGDLLYYNCTESAGTGMNVDRVVANPLDISLGQLDVIAKKMADLPTDTKVKPTIIRSDIATECIFMVTRNPNIKSYGDIARLARRITFVMPPETSGNSGTFEFLKSIDPEGLGQARRVTYVDGVNEALDEVLKEGSKSVTLFVQFPDATNARFQKVNDGGGYFVPVIDRNILRQEINGVKVYQAQQTDISNPNWTESATSVVTACTPLAIITGNPADMADGPDKLDQQDVITIINKIDASALLPKEGFWAKMSKKVMSLSASSLEDLVTLAEEGRKKVDGLVQ